MASVTPRINEHGAITSYRVQFRINGRMVAESFRDLREAQGFGSLVDKVGGREAREILASRKTRNELPTLAELTAEYLDPNSGLLTGIEPGTRREYQRISARFLPILGQYPVNAITKQMVGKWVTWLEQQPSGKYAGQTISAKTVRNYHALLSNIFKTSIELGYRTDNPAFKTRISTGVPREAVFLTTAEFWALYEAFPENYRPLVAFLVGSQLRWSEATALTGADLIRDTVPRGVRVTKAWKKNPDGAPVIGPPRSKAGRRTVSIWPWLMDQLGTPGPDQLVFRGPRGGRVWYGQFSSRIWHPAVERSGIGKRPLPHDLRHTGASWLIADGRPMFEIQKRLGHEKLDTTSSIYGHLDPDAPTRLAASLEATMTPPAHVRELSR